MLCFENHNSFNNTVFKLILTVPTLRQNKAKLIHRIMLDFGNRLLCDQKLSRHANLAKYASTQSRKGQIFHEIFKITSSKRKTGQFPIQLT